MPSESWRNLRKKTKGKVKTKTSSKQAFKNWLEGKKKAGKELASKQKAKDKGDGIGPARKRRQGGRDDGSIGGVLPPPVKKSKQVFTVETGAEQGASKALMERLIEMKQRLLAGNAEAARAGAARAEPGAWAAAAAATGRARGGGYGRGRGHGEEQGEEPSGAWGGSTPSRGGRGRGRGGERRKSQEPKQPVNREELVTLNQKIAEYARARDLSGTLSALAELEGKGWANGHTYAAAVHALCRCGDWPSAEAALNRAELRGLFRVGPGLTSGLIARTAMMRGYFEGARSFLKARQMMARMEKEYKDGGKPNTRTANTFLRGCLLFGAVDDAEALLRRMEGGEQPRHEGKKKKKEKSKKKGAKPGEAGPPSEAASMEPDASSYEHVVALLCQALRYSDAQVVAERGFKRLGAWPGSTAMFVAIARAAAVKGDLELAGKAVHRAQRLLEQETDRHIGGVGGAGGKRGRSRDVDEESSVARARSLEVFQTHRRAELEAELRDVERFVKRRREVDLTALMARTLAFEDLISTHGQASTESTSAALLVRRLCESFGLEKGSEEAEAVRSAFAKAVKTPSGRKPKKKAWRKGGKPPPASGRLDLAALFPPTEGEGEPEARPVHLELCSGNGEWLCSQALRDRASAWVACELRFDRGARCFQRLALRGLAARGANAGVIVGDAWDALAQRLHGRTCARLFINHPEPPHQRDLEAATASVTRDGGDGEGDAKTAASTEEDDHVAAPTSTGHANTHLLTPRFLREACGGVLRPGGTLTICTDSLAYGEWLLNTFATPELSEVYEDALHGTKEAKVSRLAKVGRLALRGVPPPVEACGAEYSGKAGASYFQRLKQSEKGARGQEDQRYFLCLRRREDVAG